MAAKIQPARGVDTIVYLGVLSDDQLNADPFVVPSTTAVTFEITGAIASGATSVTVPAQTVDIPAGSAITVTQGGQSYTILVSTQLDAGGTALTIVANGRAIAAGGEASFYPLRRLQGGTESDFQSTSNTQQQTVYTDPEINSGGWQTSTSLDQSWTTSFNAVVFPNSPTYSMLSFIALNKDLPLYFRREIDPGAGYTVGHGKQGTVYMNQYSEPAPASGFVTMACNFTGNLNPDLVQQTAA